MADAYNQGIRDRIATFETRERSADDLRPWLDDPAHPVLVGVDASEGGEVLGWIAASEYRPRACYAGIGEFSVYVRRDARGRGAGHALVEAFLPACAAAGLWKILSRVFPENRASRTLLAAHGFREVGTYRRHGRLDGVWKDVVIVERLLDDDRGPGAAAGAGRGDGSTAPDQDCNASGSSSSPSAPPSNTRTSSPKTSPSSAPASSDSSQPS